MNDKLMKAYHFYKAQCARFIIFFRVGDHYKAFYEDAMILNQELGPPIIDDCVTYHKDKILEVMGVMADHDLPVRTISRKNKNGEYDIPDMSEIMSEYQIDY